MKAVPTPSSETGRRTLLQRGAALLTGALGVGAAAGGVRAVAAPAAPPAAEPLRVLGRRRLVPPAEAKDAGARLLGHGDLLDAEGAVQGAFYTNGFCMQTPFGGPMQAAANLEFQTLNLPEGTLFGMGAPGGVSATATHRAILGGTGRFVGARGSYAEQEGGSGAAGAVEFVITVLL